VRLFRRHVVNSWYRVTSDIGRSLVTKTSLNYVWVVIMVSSLLQSCTGFFQKPDQALVREPGHRVYGPPVPVSQEAAKHWEFAWLSEAAYAKTAGADPDERHTTLAPVAVATDSQAKSKTGRGCPEAEDVLREAKWERWTDFPDDGLSKALLKSNLRVQVWERHDPPVVAVAFGGTVFTSGKDWRSNLRWFIPHHKDEYTEIVDVLGPAFVLKFLRRSEQPGEQHLKHADLFATGHSLGGGLAQQFAYSLPRNPLVPRVKKVYAFDPSPVTGYYSVDVETRDDNKRGLQIDRIFEREEVLAAVRSVASLLYPPSAVDPSIRAVRYSLFYTINLISGHSMHDLACKLYVASGHSIEP
jgi:hypothetical protein